MAQGPRSVSEHKEPHVCANMTVSVRTLCVLTRQPGGHPDDPRRSSSLSLSSLLTCFFSRRGPGSQRCAACTLRTQPSEIQCFTLFAHCEAWFMALCLSP